jgi:hypothetical protein
MRSYKKGSWNVIDDVSGFKHKAHRLRKRWDGVYVSKDNWEPRHPQDFLRARKDNMSVPWTRPRPGDLFTYDPYAYARSVINEYQINGFMING